MLTGSTKTVQTEGQLTDIQWQKIGALGPVALADLPIIVHRVTDQTHDHGVCQIGQLLGTESGNVKDDLAKFSGSIQVDGVYADTKTLNVFELR